ncbi:TetR/AcrR family transcriptional regulator [Thermocrispum sp.]|uniref:TetR family transcriptional regulator n=1 Tax=Thermocrispum agreste TaxID=37925 RepID=A0A2W4LSN9_9PSEU|nr:TetR/AcrR family transcriptional regulator [Thermocrispum sp.]PZM98716.1 MAG: TetR family transcriptional regulator [Thermocrispum agreste]
MASRQRLWAGTTLEQRRAARRAALLDAALDLLGEHGGAGVTVRSVCRRAGLTDRYFYENFAGRDELLSALFLQVAEELQQAMEATTPAAGSSREEQARAAVDALVSVCLDDPRKGRLLLVEPLSDPALSGVSIGVAPTFTRLVRRQLPPGASKNESVLTSVALTGAVATLFFGWLSGTLPVSREELIDKCVRTVLLFWGERPRG